MLFVLLPALSSAALPFLLCSTLSLLLPATFLDWLRKQLEPLPAKQWRQSRASKLRLQFLLLLCSPPPMLCPTCYTLPPPSRPAFLYKLCKQQKQRPQNSAPTPSQQLEVALSRFALLAPAHAASLFALHVIKIVDCKQGAGVGPAAQRPTERATCALVLLCS